MASVNRRRKRKVCPKCDEELSHSAYLRHQNPIVCPEKKHPCTQSPESCDFTPLQSSYFFSEQEHEELDKQADNYSGGACSSCSSSSSDLESSSEKDVEILSDEDQELIDDAEATEHNRTEQEMNTTTDDALAAINKDKINLIMKYVCLSVSSNCVIAFLKGVSRYF